MSMYAVLLVITLTFLCTWVIMCCLWAASRADRRNEKEEEDNADER